jgi:hypothetical protein
MNIVKTLSTSFNSLLQLVVKFRRYGKADIQTSYQANPFGVDSNPLADMVAVYGKTEQSGQTVILGYLQKNMISEPGEVRLFAMGGEGEVITNIHLTSAGKIFIGVDKGEEANAFVRFNELNANYTILKTEINAVVTSLNTFIGVYNAHTHIVTLPTQPTLIPNAPGVPAVPVTATIDDSRTPLIFTE